MHSRERNLRLRGKRLFDIIASALALVLLSPLLLILALAIWLESGRPVLFGQERMGRAFRPFTLWKFRSMRPAEGPLITAAGDKRITSLGAILRRTKLDELPQFLNVLRGDMSLVGPRPEVRQYVELYRARYELILSVAPGITDPATVEYRDEELLLAASGDPEKTYTNEVLPAKLALSEDYVLHNSMRRDLSILLRTFVAILGYGAGQGRIATPATRKGVQC